MTLALIIGHSSRAGGAVSVGGVSEYAFNKALVPLVLEACCDLSVVVVERTGTYGQLPGQVNNTGADFAVELHFNSVENPRATGTEMLHWHSSRNGRRLAQLIQEEVVGALQLPDRGLVAIRSERERGGPLLLRTRMPCVITEPFFGSNPGDWQRATERRAELVAAYARAFTRYAT